MLLGLSRPVQGLFCFLQAAHHDAIALGSYGVGLSSLPSKNVARTVTLGFVLFSFSPTCLLGEKGGKELNFGSSTKIA